MQKVYCVTKGSKIELINKAYEYSYALYDVHRPYQYMYSYDYQNDEIWGHYIEKLSQRDYRDIDKVFKLEDIPAGEECAFIKVDVRCKKNNCLSDASTNIKIDTILKVSGLDYQENIRNSAEIFSKRTDVQNEIKNTIDTIKNDVNDNSLVFTLLTDTHYVVNGNWDDTAKCIETINSVINPDGIIHLGDFTDGILDKDICSDYSHRVIDRLQEQNIPLYITIGNHDSNYFRNNPHLLSANDQYEMYIDKVVEDTIVNSNDDPWYYKDFKDNHLRILFLHSFDRNEELRYGFPMEEVSWVQKSLDSTPDDYCVLICSHEAPLPRLDYWAADIRNGTVMVDILNTWQQQHDYRLLGYIHGHTHADYIDKYEEFPIISLGCSKIEFFNGKKPEGAVREYREIGTVYQELFDTIIIDTDIRKLKFVRFGAGIDREVSIDEFRNRSLLRKTKVWAHRGASGYAPENTMEAFRLAKLLGADGIELDVQKTKDGELVVIHDEKIDRTSDGTGFVCEYTLDELRKYNYNKTHPEYAYCYIPTLKEVLELCRQENLYVNIELKTGVNYYECIENDVVEQVKELHMEDKVCYSSFNHSSIKRLKDINSDAMVGYLYSNGILDVHTYASSNNINALHPSINDVKYPGLVDKCKMLDINLNVWTANDRDTIGRLNQLGVNAIITNYPDVAIDVCSWNREKNDNTEVLQEFLHICNKKYIINEQDDYDVEDIDVNESIIEPEDTSYDTNNKNKMLHILGITYSYVRKPFVLIDNLVQKMAASK